jgi:predicted amidohydrolase YtcJ
MPKYFENRPDIVLVNGKVLTVDERFSIQQAVAIKDGKIAVVGTNQDIKSCVDGRTEVIDLKGRMVLPGINDSHTHTALWGGTRPPLAVDASYPAVKSIKDIALAVEQKVKTCQPGEWVRGLGWDEGYLQECRENQTRHPGKSDLDPISPDNPVCLVDFSVHSLLVNSKALEIAGITPDTPIPPGGDICRDPQSGELTGILKEFAAQSLVMRVVPLRTYAEKRAAILGAVKELNSMGITSLTEAALGSGGNTYQGGFLGSDCIRVYQDLMNENQLNARVNFFYLFGEYGANSFKDFENVIPQLGFGSGFGNDWVRAGGIKIFADGIPPTKTAWMGREYLGGGRGGLVLPGNTEQERCSELEKMIKFAHGHGFQVGVHAIGDRAIESTIDCFIKAEEAEPKRLRHIIMHGDFFSSKYASLAAKYGIAVSAQPSLQWTLTDFMDTVLTPREDIAQWPYRTLIEAGVHVSGSSDAPCSYPSWLQGVQSAVLRESKATGKVKNPEERISREQAIRMYTIEGAWQDHMEHLKGSIEPGKLADLCILDEDILAVEAHSIKDIPVWMTILGGQIVFKA